MLLFFRVIKFALQDMVRNMGLSLMTITMLILMLLSVNTLLSIQLLTREAATSIKEQVDMSIFFQHDATDEQIATAQKTIAAIPEITTSTFVAADDVLTQFRAQHAADKAIIASLDELKDNPFGATLIVHTRETGDYQQVIAALSTPEFADSIEAKTFADTEAAMKRIQIITAQVEHLSLIVTGMFMLIAFLIIFNTVRVAIYTQRTEISIKKLVGATNWFIRSPYLFEAILFSILSIAATMGLVFLAAHAVDPYLAVMYNRPAILTNYFTINILWLFGGELGAVLLLTMFSSALAMRRYLRV